MKRVKILLLIVAFGLTACGGGSSGSGASVEPTQAGNSLPENFLGIYRGVLNLTLSTLIVSESGSFPIVLEVMSNGMVSVTIDDEDPEMFPINNEGRFSGQASFADEDCEAFLGVSGSVNGATASGTINGEGSCALGSDRLDIEAEGDFSASKP